MTETAAEKYDRYVRALAGERLPAALVDLDAVEENARLLLTPVRAAGKTLRLATKSVRCPRLIASLVEAGEGLIAGLMTYSAAETCFLADEGHRDLLLAYPTVQPRELRAIAEVNRRGATAAVVVDCEAHVLALAHAATTGKTVIPAVVDVDLSYRPFGEGGPHLGVRRSPLRTPEAVCDLAERIASTPGLRFHGLLGYEAQIAGLPDASPFARWKNPIKRLLKRASRPTVEATRRACVEALRARGLPPPIVNGAGTGNLAQAALEDVLTEVTAGSGFLASHLFSGYRDLALVPAALFALEVTRTPAPGIHTLHGGGWVASGEPGPDRLPAPYLPEGLALLSMEGAGEVQTPVAGAVDLRPGDPVFFRHAKAGELAEHVNEYLLVRGDRVVERAPTYRGLGHAFLG